MMKAGLQICRRGFTLLEMVIAMGVMSLLLTGIFLVAKSTMELTADLSFGQERAMMRQNFIDFLRRSFRSLPGDAEVRLASEQSGGTYLPSLTFINAGTSFSPGEALPPETAIELTVEKQRGGYLRVLLREYDEEQTMALRNGLPMTLNAQARVLPLMENVSQFEWRLYDSNADSWQNLWPDGRRPLMAELKVQLDDGEPMRAVFWIPPVQRSQLVSPQPAAVGPGQPGFQPSPEPEENP